MSLHNSRRAMETEIDLQYTNTTKTTLFAQAQYGPILFETFCLKPISPTYLHRRMTFTDQFSKMSKICRLHANSINFQPGITTLKQLQQSGQNPYQFAKAQHQPVPLTRCPLVMGWVGCPWLARIRLGSSCIAVHFQDTCRTDKTNPLVHPWLLDGIE